MAQLGPALTGRLRLALSSSWSVFRVVCQAGVQVRHSLPSPSAAGTSHLATLSSHPSPLLHSATLSSCPSPLLHSATPSSRPSPLLHSRLATLPSARSYSKTKDRKGKDKQVKANVTDEEMSEVVNVEQMTSHFSHLVEALKEDYIKNLSLRTVAGSIETLPVQLEGDQYPLHEVAQVARKSPQLLIISAAAFPQALPGIVAAIRDAGMNLNPQQEGTSIIVPIPKITREYRENLAKGAKTMCNKCKEQLRDVQNQYIRKVKNKEGKFSEDLIFNIQLRIRELAEAHMHEAENMMHAKQKELLKS